MEKYSRVRESHESMERYSIMQKGTSKTKSISEYKKEQQRNVQQIMGKVIRVQRGTAECGKVKQSTARYRRVQQVTAGQGKVQQSTV
jgi:hypothetical protein